ncbi:MAG: hypothetical protein AB7O59_04600 [Pirellulales bacterium]
MLSRWHTLLLALTFVGMQLSTLAAAECRLEIVDGLPEHVDPSIVKELATCHVKIRMDDDDFFEIWTAKAWQVRDKASSPENPVSILYPLQPGSLLGVVRVAHTCYDLRDQEIPAGVYTVRYSVQPDIEAHKDSHESRDFLLLVASNVDKSPELIADQDKLIGKSAESIGSMHPAFLPLLKPLKPDQDASIRRDPRDPEGWVLQVHDKDEAGKKIAMEIIMLHAKLGS